MIKATNIHLFLLFAVSFLILSTGESFAADATAQIPGVDYSDLPIFIKTLYDWGIGIVGLLAFAQLVRGGVMYMISGAVDKKDSAKHIITDALIGLALALASYLVVYTINPQLTTVNLGLEPLGVVTSGTVTTKCMTGVEIQTYIDNGYDCNATSTATSCPSGEGEFKCIPPEKASQGSTPQTSSAKVCDSGDGQVQNYIDNARPGSEVSCEPDPSGECIAPATAYKCTVK